MRKIFALLISLTIAIVILPIKTIQAEEIYITAPSAVVIEQSTGNVLYQKNKDAVRPIASITKVMTLLLTMEALDSGQFKLDDILTASAHAASMGGSDIWLKEGEKMSVQDLIKATVIMSANDAAVVLAEAISGTEDTFVEQMNKKAEQLGMKNTVFKNCNGLDEQGHLSSAYDVALMSSELIKHEQIMQYTLTWIDYIRDNKTQLVNTNKLIRTYKGITGLKTGTTNTAGSCISATATRDGMSIIAVVLGAENTDSRFSDVTTILNYGFAKWLLVTPEITIPNKISIKDGMQKEISIKLMGNSEVLAQKDSKSNIKVEYKYNENLFAPIQRNQIVGLAKIYDGEKILKELSIISNEEVSKVTFSKIFIFLFSKFKI